MCEGGVDRRRSSTSSFVSELNVSWAVACDRAQEPPIAPCDVLGKRGKAARAASSPPHPNTSGAARAQGFSTSRRRRCVPTTSNQALRRPAMRTPPAERSRRGEKVLRQGSKSTQQCSWSALECILPGVQEYQVAAVNMEIQEWPFAGFSGCR